MLAGAASLERAGDARSACVPRSNAGFAYIELGEFEKAEEELRAVVGRANRMGLAGVEASARHNLGLALAHQGRFVAGRREEMTALAVFQAGKDKRMEIACRIALTEIELAAGQLERALIEARNAVSIAESTPRMRVNALALEASTLLALGRVEDARRPALAAADLLESLGSLEAGEALVQSVHAETLHASGDVLGARSVIAKARARLMERAMKIDDLALRKSFLERVPSHARVIARAAEWV
jgi:eukaryotic-like serine/threonine-protein kinase